MEFPDLYDEQQFEGGFHYQWPPVSFAPSSSRLYDYDLPSLPFGEWVVAF